MLSHFPSLMFKYGWKTKRCQMIVWKDSAKGVIRYLLTTGTSTQISAFFLVYPPSLLTIPAILALIFLAYLIASIRLTLTFFSSLPPPTENIKSISFLFNLLIFNQLINTLSHPSSFVLALNSAILSVGA